jgi:hypothetical protein
MALTALVAIAVTPLLHAIVEPQTAFDDLVVHDVIGSRLMTISVVSASSIVGVVVWRPPAWPAGPPVDRLQIIGTMMGLSFWVPGAIMSIGLSLGSNMESWRWRDHLAHPLILAVMGGLLGSLLFGPVAYLLGTAILWPLLRYENRVPAPRPSPSPGICGILLVLWQQPYSWHRPLSP